MPRPRRIACLVGVGCLVLTLITAGRARAGAPDRPSFLVILCDDLGYGDLACYGHPVIATPNLDRLAAEGMRLTDCYSAAPVCSPSRAGMLTGRTPNRTGVYDWIPAGHAMHLARDEVTIATLLRDAGYATCLVGKWHLNGKFNSAEQPQPGDHGFEHWFATQNNASPSHRDPKNFVRNGTPVGPLQGYSCAIVAGEAIRWLREERDRAKPFFLFVCFHEPHEPVASPPELEAHYIQAAKRGEPQAAKRGEATYYANVTNLDRSVGTLMMALDDLDLAGETLVLFTSDNGPETLNRYSTAWRSHGSPGPLRGMKLHLHDGGIRVPGIVRWPGRVPAGAVVSEPVSGVDLLPTLCGLAGVAVPADRAIDGASFAPIFEGRPVPREEPLFWTYYRALGAPKIALRDGRWKLTAAWDGPDKPVSAGVDARSLAVIKSARPARFDLYDLEADIGEANDLSAAHAEVLERLTARLVRIYRAVQGEGRSW